MMPLYGIVIVDMQEYFLSKLSKGTQESLVRNNLKLIDLCLQEGYPLFVLELKPEEYGETSPLIKDRISTFPLYSRIKKRFNDGFNGTSLLERVQDLENLVITGVNAGACVLETATSAAAAQFTVHIADDLIADGNKPRWKWDGWRRSEAYEFYRSECLWYPKMTSLLKTLQTANYEIPKIL